MSDNDLIERALTKWYGGNDWEYFDDSRKSMAGVIKLILEDISDWQEYHQRARIIQDYAFRFGIRLDDKHYTAEERSRFNIPTEAGRDQESTE